MTGLDNPTQYVHVEFLVLMHGDIVESDYSAEGFGKGGVYQSGTFKQDERLSVALWHA